MRHLDDLHLLPTDGRVTSNRPRTIGGRRCPRTPMVPNFWHGAGCPVSFPLSQNPEPASSVHRRFASFWSESSSLAAGFCVCGGGHPIIFWGYESADQVNSHFACECSSWRVLGRGGSRCGCWGGGGGGGGGAGG